MGAGKEQYLEFQKKVNEGKDLGAGVVYVVYCKSNGSTEMVEPFDALAQALDKIEELYHNFENEGAEPKVSKTIQSPIKYSSFCPAPSKKRERIQSFSANGEFYYVKKFASKNELPY